MKGNSKILNKVIVLAIVSTVITIINSFIGYNLIPIHKLENTVINQFSLVIITSSIFAGFSFTNISILISLSSAELIKKLCNTTIMLSKNNVLITCITFCFISIVTSFIFVLKLDYIIIQPVCFGLLERDLYYKIYPMIIDFIYNLSVLSFISSFLYFVKSIIEMSNLLIKVYRSNNPKITDNDVKLFKKRLAELEVEKNKLENKV